MLACGRAGFKPKPPDSKLLWLPVAPSKRQGLVLKVVAPPASVSHPRSSGECVSWLWSPEGVYLRRKESQLLTKKEKKKRVVDVFGIYLGVQL